MKKGLLILLVLLLSVSVFSCSKTKGNNSGEIGEAEKYVETDESVLAQHKKIKENGGILGVAYLGKRDSAFETLGEFLNRQHYWSDYPMFASIMPDNFIEERGEEVLLLLPIEGVTVKVYECEYDYENETYKKGKEYDIPQEGRPLYLQGTMTDYNFVIVAEGDGKKVEFLPFVDEEDDYRAVEDKLVYDIFS